MTRDVVVTLDRPALLVALGLLLMAGARTMAASRLDLGLMRGGRQWESLQKQGWRQGTKNASWRAISDGWRPVVGKCCRGS